jgi:4-amino-4-deoxy-L-arabinose transferase-like glycosyltransferase
MIAFIKRSGPALLALFAGAVALLPVVIWGVPSNPDLANHYRFALPFYEAIQRGDFHPGWLASPNLGYGETAVRFYPPALYYLLAAGRTLTGNWYSGSLLVLTLASGLGSLGAYFWARSYVPRNIAVWAAVFYALMPYHLAEVYQAAQLAEFGAGAALLFSLAFTKRLCDQGRLRDLVGLAASYALLILSHLPLAVFGSLALLVYALLNIPKKRARTTIPKLAAAVLLGLASSAFYWTTMVAEFKWIVADGAHPDPLLDYRRNFVFSTFSPEKSETIWWMGLLAIATIMMLAPAFVVFANKVAAPSKCSLAAVAVLVVFSLIMTTWISKPLWVAIPLLPMAQHPFRWLAITSAVAPILMSASLPFWVERFRRPRRAIALAMAGLVLIAASFSISQTVRGATYLSRPTFEQMLRPLKDAPGIIQWLPVWASATGQGKASYEKCIPPSAPTKIEAGERTVRITEWNDLSRTFEVESGHALDARVSTFYYPHWMATANGNVLSTRPAADGALLISLPAERVTVNLQFREPRRAKLSGVVSIISWTLLASLLILGTFVSQRREHEPIEVRREH